MAIVLSGSLILSGSLEATGGVTISGSIASASFATTGSYSLNALTSSNALTASSADTLYVRNNVTALGSITAQTLIVQTVTSSVLFTTGSNKIGSSLSNVQELTGSVGITGSLSVNTNGTEFQVNAGGVNIGNALTDNHVVSGSLRVNPNGLFVSSSGNVGIGTSSPSSILVIASSVANDYLSPESQVTITNTSSGGHSALGFRTTDSDGTHGRAGITVAKDSGSVTGAMKFIVRQNSGAFLQAMQITSAGRVGIGTSSPAQRLTVANPGGTAGISIDSENTSYQSTLYFTRAGVGKWELGMTSTNEDWYLYGTNEAIYVKRSNGVVTFKSTSTDIDTLTVCNNSGKVNVKIGGAGGSANFGGISMLDNTSTERVYLITDTTAMSFMFSGLAIGASTGAYKLTLNGQPGANGYTAWTNYSDLRLKENIEPLVNTNILDKINSLNPVTFNYNEASGYNEETRSRRISGFIAQELQEIFPEMVGNITLNGEEYLDTNLSNLSLYLVKAIQEQQAQIDELKAKLQ
jgi:hypothetical protein